METHNLSDYDRALIAGLTDAINRLAEVQEIRNTEKIYTCKEAAKMIGRSQQTISRYIRQGRIKKGTRGGTIGIPESEIRKFLSGSPD